MSVYPKIFVAQVIKPVLHDMGLFTESAINLLAYTFAHESLCGRFLKQIAGPALGPYQIEPATHEDIFNRILPRFCDKHPDFDAEKYNLKAPDQGRLEKDYWYSTIFCRLHYWSIKEPLPEANNILALALYWKRYYNTYLGKGKVEDFIAHAEKLKDLL